MFRKFWEKLKEEWQQSNRQISVHLRNVIAEIWIDYEKVWEKGDFFMLQEWKAMEKPEEEEIRVRLAAAKEKLAKQQLLIKEQKIPVLVLMEGWGTAGKGSVIGQVIQNIDLKSL